MNKEDYRRRVLISGWVLLIGLLIGGFEMSINGNYHTYSSAIKIAIFLIGIGGAGINYYDKKFQEVKDE